MAFVVEGDTMSLGETNRKDEEQGISCLMPGQLSYVDLFYWTGNRLGESLRVGQKKDQKGGHYGRNQLWFDPGQQLNTQNQLLTHSYMPSGMRERIRSDKTKKTHGSRQRQFNK